MSNSAVDKGARVFVVGCGSIGQRHVRNLRALGVANIAVFDPLPARMEHVAREYDVASCANIPDGLARHPHAVLICTPPHLHTAIAKDAVDEGAHIFLEKPLASSLDGVDELLDAARRVERVIYVAYNLRFHAGLRKLRGLLSGGVIGRPLVIRAEVGQYLPDWRPNQDYRAGYNVSAAMGGGIILDASHELDYVRWLGGEIRSIYCAAGKLGDLEMEAEDTAEMTLRIEGGILGQIHLDCVQRGYARNCKVIGTQGTLLWEFSEGVRHLMVDKTWRVYPISPDANEMYVEEMRHFLACMRGVEKPLVDGDTGKRVLQIALAARQSAATHGEISL